MPETTTAPRLAPLEAPYDPEIEAQLKKWMPPDAPVEPLALFRTLVLHPDLASRMRPLGSALLGHGLIEPRQRELVVMRTCARCGAEYEWGVHAVAFASTVGLSDDQIAATAIGDSSDPAWQDGDAALVRLADELYDSEGVSDDLWDELRAAFSPAQILELIVTAGWYRTISYVVNAARVPLEAWAARFPGARASEKPGSSWEQPRV